MIEGLMKPNPQTSYIASRRIINCYIFREIMKKLSILVIFLTTAIYAEDHSMQKIFINFESAYMSNDVVKFKPWLAEDYSLTQTLHIPEMGSDSRNVSKKALLQSMKMMKTQNSTPRSILDNITIEKLTGNKFCGSSKTKNNTTVSGKVYEELETRKVCFDKDGSNYQAYLHEIDVHYSAN